MYFYDGAIATYSQRCVGESCVKCMGDLWFLGRRNSSRDWMMDDDFCHASFVALSALLVFESIVSFYCCQPKMEDPENVYALMIGFGL